LLVQKQNYGNGAQPPDTSTNNNDINNIVTLKIKQCPREAQTCALPLFCDLGINPTTLKLEGDLDILKMYIYTENEAASLVHSNHRD